MTSSGPKPDPTLIVIAKAPDPGRVKTRLCPPCTPEQASELAEAALQDTLDAVLAAPAGRRVLALQGEPGEWLPPGFQVISQRGRGFAERLAAAFADSGGPAFLVAMDTPQLTPALLEASAARLTEPGVDATIGPTPDGGYWGIGLRRPQAAVFRGVPMSTNRTRDAQMRRLRALGLRTKVLPVLTDVDTMTEAQAVAFAAPSTRFACRLEELGHATDHQQPVSEAAA